MYERAVIIRKRPRDVAIKTLELLDDSVEVGDISASGREGSAASRAALRIVRAMDGSLAFSQRKSSSICRDLSVEQFLPQVSPANRAGPSSAKLGQRCGVTIAPGAAGGQR